MRFQWPLAAASLLRLPIAFGTLVNSTIDDELGDEHTGTKITYTPPDAWSTGKQCHGCPQPDPARAHLGTWHEANLDPSQWSTNSSSIILSASATFHGTAVYVYCVIPESSTDPTGTSDMTFFIDGQQVGSFSQPSFGTLQFMYNVNVYANDSLPDGNHTLTLQNGHSAGFNFLPLLDYITYSYDNEAVPSSSSSILFPKMASSQESSSNSRSKIIGGIFAAIGVLVIATLIFLVSRRFKDKQPSLPFAWLSSGRNRSLWFGRRTQPPRSITFNPSLLVQRSIPNPNFVPATAPLPNASPYPTDFSSATNLTDIPRASSAGAETVPPPPWEQPDPHFSQFIQEWRKGIVENAGNAPLVMPGIESSDVHNFVDRHRTHARPPPPPRPKRRFTVMNN